MRSPRLRAVTVGMVVITVHVAVDGYVTCLDMASLVPKSWFSVLMSFILK
jgi:hypothetical protein